MAAQLQVIPAVDLLGEEAVRLVRGDFDDVTLRLDPERLVRRYADAGAGLIHVVDLDAARHARLRPQRIERLTAIATPAAVQASGGIRSVADAKRLLRVGASRVVVGTAAFESPHALGLFADALGDKLVVAIDVREGRVAVRAWRNQLTLSAEEAAARCADAGVRRILCTSIERDGTLEGPDLHLLEAVASVSGLPVLAAGGVRSQADLLAVSAAGCEAVVVGRALAEELIPLSSIRDLDPSDREGPRHGRPLPSL